MVELARLEASTLRRMIANPSPGIGRESFELRNQAVNRDEKITKSLGVTNAAQDRSAEVRRYIQSLNTSEWEQLLRDAFGLAPESLPTREVNQAPLPEDKLEDVLFKNLSSLKIMTSKVAMHLSSEQRSSLFKKLDNLLAKENWDPEDAILNPASFATYLRLILLEQELRPASLGVSNAGNLLAAWMNGSDRLTVEFLPNDFVRWSLAVGGGEERELAAGQIRLQRLNAVLEPYKAAFWWKNARHSDRRE